MRLDLTWTYDENGDRLCVDFPKPDFDPKTPILLNLGWSHCRNYFPTHDFFGRRPRTSYNAAEDTLIISFPPYNLLLLERDTQRVERQDNVHTVMDRATGFILFIRIERALTSLLWDLPPPASDEETLERRATCSF